MAAMHEIVFLAKGTTIAKPKGIVDLEMIRRGK